MEAAKKDACLSAIEQLHEQEVASDDCLTGSSGSDFCEDEDSREVYEMLVPSLLKQSWNNLEDSVTLHCYYLEFCPVPNDRTYKKFGLFIKVPLPQEAERYELDLHLDRGRSVTTKLSPCGTSVFDKDEIMYAQNFQEMYLKVIFDRSKFASEHVQLGTDVSSISGSTFYLLLPVILHGYVTEMTVDWYTIKECLSSPIFRHPSNMMDREIASPPFELQLANGPRSISKIENSLVAYNKKFYFVTNIVPGKNGYTPLLRAKQLFRLHHLLLERGQKNSESREKKEHFMDLFPKHCELKIIAFSKDIGSSISLLPSIMHRLENLLVAIELKCLLSTSFPEGAEVTAQKVLEALTTENCQECLSLERLEILGDAFLKFVVSRNLFLSHDTLDEGELTTRRSNAVNNSNLIKVAIKHNLQVYIRDQPFDPCQFFALGHPCPTICSKETEGNIHSQHQVNATEVRCSKGHHWLRKKTIADVVEALVGAFLVDSGFKAAAAFLRWIGIEVDFDASQVINVCQASSRCMSLAPSMDIAALENSLGYQFLYRGLLLQAFVHPSYNKHGGGCYQRLEFLGDAVLDYAITSYLFSAYPKLKPGELTDLRSALVNNRAFANVAIDRSFDKFIFCDSNDLSKAIEKYADFVRKPASERGLHEGPNCPKVLSDLVESCMGAILLDTGIDLNRIWVITLSFLSPLTSISNIQLNPTRELQELCRAKKWDLQCETQKEGRNFVVEVKVDKSLTASISNPSKKEATRIASEQILAKLKDRGCTSKSRSLEEILKSSCRMEAKLIGYNESPVDVNIVIANDSENLRVQESSVNNSDNSDLKIDSTCRMSGTVPSCFRAVCKKPPSLADSIREQPNETRVESGTSSLVKGVLDGSARSRLFEICAVNHWKPPVFECCHEEGPSNLKSFTYKAIVQIGAGEDMILECFGAPRTTKKTAAEHAAEAALWCLEREGHLIAK